MTSSALKKNIHQAVDSIDDPAFLKAVFTIVSAKANEHRLTAAQLATLDEREQRHLNGESKSYRLGELRKVVRSRK